LTNGVYGLESATGTRQAGEAEKRKGAGWRKMVVDMPLEIRQNDHRDIHAGFLKNTGMPDHL
jgi:hypothetical protein